MICVDGSPDICQEILNIHYNVISYFMMKNSFKRIRKLNMITAAVAMGVIIGIVLFLNNKLGNVIRETSALTSIINTAGNQRMLSQNILKNALILIEDSNNTLREKKLDSLVTLFRHSHETLLELQDSGTIESNTLDSLYTKINPYYVELLGICEELQSNDSISAGVKQQLLKAESDFLVIMDEILLEYEHQIGQVWENVISRTSHVVYVIVLLMLIIGFGASAVVQHTIDKFSRDLEKSQNNLEKAHAEIKSKFDKLDFVTNAIQVGIWEKSVLDDSESWSPRLYQLLGFETDEFEGTYKKFVDRVHPSDKEVLNQAAEESFKSGEATTIEVRVKTKDGSYKWVEATGKIKRNNNNQVTLLIGGILDINARKILENQLKVFVENAPAAIAMFDRSMNYLVVSDKWCKDYKLDKDSIIGSNHYDIFPEIGEDWKGVHQKCLGGVVANRAEDRFERANGDVHWMKWEVRPWYISDDEVGGLIMLTQDITDSKLKQEELRKAKDEAINASKAKEQFLATMSHEIRTPLNAINGLTHLLLSEDPRPDQVESLDLLKFSGDNLLSLINDILDISKIESGKLKLEAQTFDLPYLLENIRRSLEYKARESLVSIETRYDDRLPKLFVGDVTRVAQIIYNLAGNAIKFTEDGKVQIDIEYVSSKEKTYTFKVSVIDEGIGISPENQKKIFKSFEQADSGTTRKYGGTGLGLYISKKLLKMMGAEIKLESTLGKGSTFYFNLTLKEGSLEVQERTKLDMKDVDFSDRNVSVLVAEDNIANQVVMKKFLAKAGIKFKIDENGSIILDEILSKSYDMILMDLQMPVMDGYSTTEAIRSRDDSYFKNIPIIALTADAFLDIKGKAMSVGMNDYLSKPFKPSELFGIIHKYAEKGKGIK